MSNTVISVENLSKEYRLGQIGTGTLSRDINVWWAKVRGKPNPFLKIGQTDHGNRDGETIFALKDVSFTVEQGEALGIIGRNGAGKSTLLKILSRVTAPTSGRIKVKGRIASLLEVGTGFHPDLTGRENIYLNGAILGMTRQEVRRKLDEIVAFAEIEKFIDTPVKRYSSGMYVRLAFAVAAHLDPEILVVDEVLAVGDAEFQKKCLGKMGDVAKGGRTVLFVSHNMASINGLCNSTLLMDKGQLQASGEVNEIIAKYLSMNLTSETHIQSLGYGLVKPTISDVSVINTYGEQISNIPMGQPFGIQVEFRSPYPINRPELGIRINTIKGNSIIGITSYMQNMNQLASNLKEGIFEVLFTNPNLNQGTYSITLTLADGMQSIDRKEDIISFGITPLDVFGTGKIPSEDQASIFTDAKWSIISIPALIEKITIK
jgi:lipopolysaccharide transport system ATP-binding protein